MKPKSPYKILLSLLAASATLAVPATAGAVTLFGSGSSAEQPVMNVLFRAYNKAHHNIRFSYNPNGGNAGVADVQRRHSQFAINTRPPLPSDSGTTYVKIFLDGLCIATNRANSLSNLQVAQVKNIFTGVTTNWSQVSGSSLAGTIDPIGRNSAAGTYTFFKQAVLGNATQASNVVPETSDGLVQTAVSRDRNAIGYVGLLHTGGLRKLTLNGVPCDDAHIKNNSYPLWRWVWAVIPNTHRDKRVVQFINWVATSHTAGGVIHRAGAVPAFNK